MLSYSKDGITMAIIHDTRRENKDKCYPVKIRVTYKRERVYYPTGKYLSVTDWENIEKTKSSKYKPLREDIENSYSIIKKHVEELAKEDRFSFTQLNIRMNRCTGDTLNSALQHKIDVLRDEDRIGTMQYYTNIKKSVESFGGASILLESVTVEWLRKLEKHMLTKNNYTTIGMYMRGIRAVMNEAKKAGSIKEYQYPFGKDRYEIKTGQGKKKALTLEQIAKIAKFTDDAEATERYKDLWLFIYLCNGINCADLISLKYSNIVDDEICFVREKTKRTTKTVKEIRAVITPQMQSIIDRWGTEKKPDNYIFGFLTGNETAMQFKIRTKDITRRINRRMKSIGESLGIGKISTYTARHTYATVLKRSGANIAYISESLGHTDLKTTENYLASFEKEERKKNAELLLGFRE